MTNVRNKGRKRPDANPFQFRCGAAERHEEGSALESMASPPPPTAAPSHVSRCLTLQPSQTLHFFEHIVFLAFLNLCARRCLWPDPSHPHTGLAITSVLRARRLTSCQCRPLPHAVLRHSAHLHYAHYSRSGLCCLALRLLGTHSWKGENYSVYL